MPPTAKFTQGQIIDAAMQIVREQGIEAVTAREIGNRLGSSARPIFTVFKNMEEVNEGIRKDAKRIYKEYIAWGLRQTPAFRGVGAAYIRFAKEEPRLFHLLFMTTQGTTNDLEHILALIDESYEDILKSVQEPYQLDAVSAKRLYQHLWIYTHGIAALCATNVCTFTEEEIQNMMTEIFKSLLEKMKREEKK